MKLFISQSYQLQNITSTDRPDYERKIQLIDTLLKRSNDSYLNISVLCDSESAVRSLSGSDGDHVDLERVPQDYTQYVTQDTDDFRFKLSDESKNIIGALANHINTVIRNRTNRKRHTALL
jgi:hypothetical protein